MQHIYTETVNLEMENLPPFIEQGVIEFFPHVGHCLCLRSWLQNDNPITAETDVNIPGLELKVNMFCVLIYRKHLSKLLPYLVLYKGKRLFQKPALSW
jgi:hypothetical protein